MEDVFAKEHLRLPLYHLDKRWRPPGGGEGKRCVETLWGVHLIAFAGYECKRVALLPRSA
jgi:hypothetical protein